ncbi:MAG: 1-deoxy-D-xylulose-5-phosphate synthase N-terminal domain-containing protein [Spirochaetia bacterium]|jgi:transketolase
MDPVCREIRRNILTVAKESGHGHIPTCFSIVEVLRALYATMKQDPARPEWEKRDIFVLSKGHAALALYCALAEFGYFPPEDVRSLGAFMSNFGCHADRTKLPGVEVSTGSLGHGIGVAAGIALAFKIQKSDRRVFTLIGDGESNEGSVWEAIMVAVDRKLNNLTVIYDDNQSHARGLQIKDPEAQFGGFGCEVVGIAGHDHYALMKAIEKPSDGMKVIVAHTVKGYGCETLVRDQYAWHRRSPNDEEFQVLMRELDEKAV